MTETITIEQVSISVDEVERETVGPGGDQTSIRVHLTIATDDDASERPRRVPPVELRDSQGRNYPPTGAQGMEQAPAPRYRAPASATFVVADTVKDVCLVIAPGTTEEVEIPLGDLSETGLRWERGEQES